MVEGMQPDYVVQKRRRGSREEGAERREGGEKGEGGEENSSPRNGHILLSGCITPTLICSQYAMPVVLY